MNASNPQEVGTFGRSTTPEPTTTTHIASVLVANRGEIARRVFRTCRELGIRTVAVFSDADAGAPFVGEADVAVRLPGSAPSDTYLRGDLVIAAAVKAGADAVHPGYGFLSENAQFARDVEAAGLTWIGPTPHAIEAMGDKIHAKELMAEAGVPQLGRLEHDAITSFDLPVLVKASAGGGGRGMRIVRQLDELERTIEQASAEAASAFGDPTVFVEHYLEASRHVEVQVVGDTHGTVWVVGDRDCSIQRRHQKVVEEAPAPGLSDSVRAVLHDAARAAAQAVDYVGAGTVEFMVAPAGDGDDRVFFLEMNTRLQVEHPVTEEVFGLDLVALQLAVAEGRPLVGDVPPPSGHAVEVRLYAEDPSDDWQPQTGTLRTFDVPVGPGVRVDSGVESGSTVGIHYDAMIAKIVAHGPDRSTAVRRLDGVLRRSRIHGVTTNLDFLRAILTDADFAAARLRTTLLDDRLAAWTTPRMDAAQRRRAAVAAALAEATAASTGAAVLSRIPTAYRNVPSQPRTRTYEPDLTISYSSGLVLHDLDDVRVVEATATRVALDVGGVVETYAVAVGRGSVDVDGPHGSVDLVPVPVFVDPSDVVAEGSLLAPMPAAVVEVAVADGQDVRKGDVVVVLEAMKMQHTITAPTDGVVTQLSVTPGSQVESGAVLAVIDVSTGESPQGEKP
jgi:propionyl-CoA carboxylase alpha chain